MNRQPVKRFQDLIVWQKAHGFVLNVYKMSKALPGDEQYGLISQIRRAAVSITANIAEGFKKKTRADKARYINIAQSSLEECRYYMILISDINYCTTFEEMARLEEVSKLLDAYYKSMASES